MHVEIFEGSGYKANAYLVHDRKDAMVVDAPAGTADRIVECLKEKKLELKFIILTHVHWDHVEDLEKLKTLTGAKACMHNFDYYNQSEINSVLEGAKEIRIESSVSDKDAVDAGTIKLSVIHTPGHTPGSVCLYSKKDNALFSGDTLFKGTYGRTDLPHGSDEDMRKSLAALSMLPAKTAVYPGHGPETTIGEEKWIKKVQ